MLSVTGIILAGGYSRRMGSDKALLELDGKTVIARIAVELTEITDTVLIACGEQERPEYAFLKYPLVVDRYPDCGPLGGLHAALSCSSSDWNLVTACDLPFVSADLLRKMLNVLAQTEQTIGVHAVVAVSNSGRVQPLLALYHKDVVLGLEDSLAQKHLRVMEWLEKLNVIYVSEEELCAGSDRALTLLNMNTPEDYDITVRTMADRRV